MPKIKPTSPKKSSLKATKKSKAKKVVKGKSGHEDTHLHQAFVATLHTLEKHWDKKVIGFKKQLDSLKDKLEKSQVKQKAVAKGKSASAALKEKVVSLQAEIAKWRHDHSLAKLAAAKYNSLRKTIDTVEREWLQKLADSTATVLADKAAKAEKSAKVEKKADAQKTRVTTKLRQADKATKPKKQKATRKTVTASKEVSAPKQRILGRGLPTLLPEETDESIAGEFSPEHHFIPETAEEEILEDFSTEEEFDNYNS